RDYQGMDPTEDGSVTWPPAYAGGIEQLGDIMAAVEKTTKQPQNKHVSAPWTDPRAVPYIRIENVTKKFGEFVAVNNVSLNIYRGELFSLLGGSGCGKTTLLRMLAGFENPTSGKIYIDGVDMAGIPPYDRPTNMMFQSY